MWSPSNRENRGENLMLFEHWDLKTDEAYMRDAISSWYSEGSKFSADDPSKALRYTQVGQAIVSHFVSKITPFLVNELVDVVTVFVFHFHNCRYIIHVSDAVEVVK